MVELKKRICRLDDLSLRFLAMVAIGITAFAVGILALKVARIIFEKVFAEQIKRLEEEERSKNSPHSCGRDIAAL